MYKKKVFATIKKINEKCCSEIWSNISEKFRKVDINDYYQINSTRYSDKINHFNKKILNN